MDDVNCDVKEESESMNLKTAKKTSKHKQKPSAPLYVPPVARARSPASEEPVGELKLPEDVEETEDSWDTLYDDSGNCVKPELVEDFKKLVNIKSEITVKQIKCDEVEKKLPETNLHPHVLELYDFDPAMRESDIFMRLSTLGSRQFEIVWVDDTHALVVFDNEMAAKSILDLVIPDLKVRSMDEATSASKTKAGKSVERLLPYKKRPQTSVSAAKRLVHHYLGVGGGSSRSDRKAEKQLLQEAKERRKQNKEQSTAVWDGNV